MIIYQAFIEAELEAPRHLDRKVHDLYFNPTVEEFQPRTMWSLSNAFTSAFKELEPVPQFKATGSCVPRFAVNHSFVSPEWGTDPVFKARLPKIFNSFGFL